MKTCTELLEALEGKVAEIGKYPRSGDSWDTVGLKRRIERIPEDHFDVCVKALERRHDEFWDDESHGCDDYGGPYLEECKALLALRRDLEAALEVN